MAKILITMRANKPFMCYSFSDRPCPERVDISDGQRLYEIIDSAKDQVDEEREYEY